jgi:large subunit ribosomal protein L25
MDTPTLKATTRTMMGKQVKLLRSNGQLPGVLYGHGQESTSLTFDTIEYNKLFRKAGMSTLVDLVIDEAKPVKVLLHAPQVHPAKAHTIHADFYAVKMTEKLQTEIPLHFIGESEAVDVLDGSLATQLDALNVECFPDKLVSSIEVDLSALKTFDDIIRVENIVVPEGIEVLNDPEEVVAVVNAPRSEEELEALDAEVQSDEEAVAALEVTGEKPADEAAEAEGDSKES